MPYYKNIYKRNSGSKYHAQKIVVDGIEFDSKREAKRYSELVLLQKCGQISDLQLQVKYKLLPSQYAPDTVDKNGKIKKGKLLEREITYIADFVYKENGETVVEDAKGMRRKDYIIKRKLMLYVYRIRIKEV